MLEFTGEEDSNDDLVDGALNEHDADQTEDSVPNIPQFEEPLFSRQLKLAANYYSTHEEFKERYHSNQADDVCSCSP